MRPKKTETTDDSIDLSQLKDALTCDTNNMESMTSTDLERVLGGAAHQTGCHLAQEAEILQKAGHFSEAEQDWAKAATAYATDGDTLEAHVSIEEASANFACEIKVDLSEGHLGKAIHGLEQEAAFLSENGVTAAANIAYEKAGHLLLAQAEENSNAESSISLLKSAAHEFGKGGWITAEADTCLMEGKKLESTDHVVSAKSAFEKAEQLFNQTGDVLDRERAAADATAAGAGESPLVKAEAYENRASADGYSEAAVYDWAKAAQDYTEAASEAESPTTRQQDYYLAAEAWQQDHSYEESISVSMTRATLFNEAHDLMLAGKPEDAGNIYAEAAKYDLAENYPAEGERTNDITQDLYLAAKAYEIAGDKTKWEEAAVAWEGVSGHHDSDDLPSVIRQAVIMYVATPAAAGVIVETATAIIAGLAEFLAL